MVKTFPFLLLIILIGVNGCKSPPPQYPSSKEVESYRAGLAAFQSEINRERNLLADKLESLQHRIEVMSHDKVYACRLAASANSMMLLMNPLDLMEVSSVQVFCDLQLAAKNKIWMGSQKDMIKEVRKSSTDINAELKRIARDIVINEEMRKEQELRVEEVERLLGRWSELVGKYEHGNSKQTLFVGFSDKYKELIKLKLATSAFFFSMAKYLKPSMDGMATVQGDCGDAIQLYINPLFMAGKVDVATQWALLLVLFEKNPDLVDVPRYKQLGLKQAFSALAMNRVYESEYHRMTQLYENPLVRDAAEQYSERFGMWRKAFEEALTSEGLVIPDFPMQ